MDVHGFCFSTPPENFTVGDKIDSHIQENPQPILAKMGMAFHHVAGILEHQCIEGRTVQEMQKMRTTLNTVRNYTFITKSYTKWTKPCETETMVEDFYFQTIATIFLPIPDGNTQKFLLRGFAIHRNPSQGSHLLKIDVLKSSRTQ